MSDCSEKNTCINYPEKCVNCGATSEIYNHYPCYKDVDEVKVVRCKDCKNYEYMGCNNQYFCNRFGGYVNENDYCSRCERITNNG